MVYRVFEAKDEPGEQAGAREKNRLRYRQVIKTNTAITQLINL